MTGPHEVGYRRKPASRPRLRLGRLTVLAAALGVTIGASVAAFAGTDPAAPPPAALVAPATTSPTSTAAPATTSTAQPTPAPTTATTAAAPPPKGSGSGRRIVFDQSDQRVWLIEDDETVDRTYLVSGSRFDNLQPGTYDVQSKQRHATSFDYTGTMEYFVRFTTGWSAPIGFHSIPVYTNGELEQTVDQLGEPLSAGCIRQQKKDAKYLWGWAPVGTTVVVTA